MPRSRPRLASSSNAIILLAIGSSPPELCGLVRIEPTPATDGLHSRAIPSCREGRPHRPDPAVSCHSRGESANDLFSTLRGRVQADHRLPRYPYRSGMGEMPRLVEARTRATV